MKLRSLSIAVLAVVTGALAFVPTSAQETEPASECAGGKGLSEPIEVDIRDEYPELDEQLRKVDQLENLINQRLGGHPTEPDPSVIRDRIDAFTAEGGLGE